MFAVAQHLELPSSPQRTAKPVISFINKLFVFFEREIVTSSKATSTQRRRTVRVATVPTVTPANAIHPLVHGRPQRNGDG